MSTTNPIDPLSPLRAGSDRAPAALAALPRAGHRFGARRRTSSSRGTSSRRWASWRLLPLPAAIAGLVSLSGLVGLALPARGQTPYVAPGYQAQLLPTQVSANAAAVAYGPDGTLYVVQGSGSNPSSVIDVVEPNGALGTPINVTNYATAAPGGYPTLAYISSATWDSSTNTLLVADQDTNAIYSVPVTGPIVAGQINVSATSYATVDTTTSEMAVNAAGQIFYTNAPLAGDAGVYLVNQATPVISSTNDFTAGIGFDSSGHLVYQTGDFNYSGVQSANVDTAVLSTVADVTTGVSSQFASNTPSYDLAVGSGNNLFLTGILAGSGGVNTYGLFSQTAGATTPLVTFSTTSLYDYGLNVTYNPTAGSMAFVLSDYSGSSGLGPPGSTYIYLVSPVPEPSSLALAALGGSALFAARRWRSRRRVG